MSVLRSLTYCSALAVFFLCACAPATEISQKRYFWPLPIAGVEPRIEYLDFFQSDEDLRLGSDGWMDTYVYGKIPSKALFVSPFGVSSASGDRVFVTDTSMHKTLVLDRKTGELRNLKNTQDQPHFVPMPLNVSEAADGSVYVVESLKGKVYKYDAQEKLVGQLADAAELIRPVAVAVDDRSGLIYVVDVGSHCVFVFDAMRNFVSKFGERGHGDGQFNYPTDIDVDAEGNLFVLDTMNFRVQMFDSSGAFVRKFGEQGTELGSFRMPKGLAVSPQGDVYVTDAMSHKFVVFDREGNFLSTLGEQAYHLGDGKVSPGGLYVPRGIDVDKNGGIWVVDGMNKMVHQFQYLTDSFLEKFPISDEHIFIPKGAARR